jgi:phosphoglycolate phosphatase-like HAD superfamily hydrolase
MSRSCIVFDLDETLISTTKRHLKIFNDFFLLNSLCVKFDSRIYLHLRKNLRLTNSEVYFKIVSDNNLFSAFRKFYLMNIENLNYLSLDSLILSKESIILLNGLIGKSDFKLLSLRNDVSNSNLQLKQIGVHHLFSDVFFLPHDISFNPKTPLLVNLKSRYDRVVFIGDALSDYEAAFKAKVEFIKVKTGLWDFEYEGTAFDDVNEFLVKINDYL